MPGFAPFGITLFGDNNLWVSYAMQDAAKHDPVHQVGAGYVDIFTTNGVFVQRFATGGKLNAPWGMGVYAIGLRPLGRRLLDWEFRRRKYQCVRWVRRRELASLPTKMASRLISMGSGRWYSVADPTKPVPHHCTSPQARIWRPKGAPASFRFQRRSPAVAGLAWGLISDAARAIVGDRALDLSDTQGRIGRTGLRLAVSLQNVVEVIASRDTFTNNK